MRNHEIVAHLCGCECEAVWHCHRKRLRMPRPRQYDALAPGAELFTNRHHVGERLTGMMHRRFKIDDRHRGISRECVEHWIDAFFRPVFQSRKRSDTDGDTVSLE